MTRLLAAAREAFAGQRLDDALAAFHAVLALDPAHCRAQAGIARCHALGGRYDAAIAAARQAIASGPREPWGHVALVVVLYQAERFEALVTAVAEIPFDVLSDDQYGNVHAMLSHAYARLQEHPDTVEDAARAAVGRAPELAFAHEALANALVLQDRIVAARAAIARAIALDPDTAVYRERATALDASIALAESSMAALRAAPEPTATDLLNAGSFLVSLDRLDEALAVYDRGVLLAPDDELLVYLRERTQRLIAARAPRPVRSSRAKKPRASPKPKPPRSRGKSAAGRAASRAARSSPKKPKGSAKPKGG